MEFESPTQFLKNRTNAKIKVILKWGLLYEGILVSYDKYFNLHLKEAIEYVNGEEMGCVGQIIIRCNNIAVIEE